MSVEPASSSGIVLEGIDDVEDYVWANEGEGSLSWDRYSHVYDIVDNGNRAFRENRFEEAINNYSRANNMKPGDHVILGNRSAAYMRISQFLKSRSPTASELGPLNGLDMTTLAELALKDAERLMSLQNNGVRSYILKANALILLERYEMARDIILSGLQIDPFSAILRASLRSLERRPSSLVRTRCNEGPERTDDFDCTLCLKLLYEPITTPCGHSFCRSCLFQTMDRSNKCPLCRTVLFISPRTCAISVTLNNIIQKNFPEEFNERKSENDSLIHLGNDLIPLFVMDVVIPCQKFPLHIFEPRYRLMVRRIMEGNHRMGMVIRDPATESIADFACEVEITECEPLPDGRFVLEIESRRRFRVLRSWDQDGYRMAEVEWVQDVPPRDAREREDLQESTNNAAAYARSWLSAEKEATRNRRRLEMLQNVEVMMPNTRDPERFSFWLATLSNRRPPEKLELLRIRDTSEVHGRILRDGIQSDCLLLTTLMDFYSSFAGRDEACKVFDEMPQKDTVAWNVLISCYLRNGKTRDVLMLFDSMKDESVCEPDDVTCLLVTQACANLGALEFGEKVHHYIKERGYESARNLSNSLIAMYSRCGCLDKAYDVFKGIGEKNVISWSSMISGLAKNGYGRDAILAFEDMQRMGIVPDEQTFTGLLSACSHCGLVDEGMDILNRMNTEFGIKPNVRHYGCVVDLLGRAGLLDQAYQVIISMKVKPDATIWRTLLGACRIHGHFNLGERVIEHLIELKAQEAGDYVLLLNMYSSTGNWEKVMELRKFLKDKGIQTTPGCSSIELKGVVHEFIVDDVSHPRKYEIYDKLDEINKQLKIGGYVSEITSELHDLGAEEKANALSYHSEKLALAFGILATPPGTTLRVTKNLRICIDCHNFAKFLSGVYDREVIIRDRTRFHHFRYGHCSCNDYW